jgi:hypothetical protein
MVVPTIHPMSSCWQWWLWVLGHCSHHCPFAVVVPFPISGAWRCCYGVPVVVLSLIRCFPLFRCRSLAFRFSHYLPVPRSPLPFPCLLLHPSSSCPSFIVSPSPIAVPLPSVCPVIFLSLICHFPLSCCCFLTFCFTHCLPVSRLSFPLLFPGLWLHPVPSLLSAISVVAKWYITL